MSTYYPELDLRGKTPSSTFTNLLQNNSGTIVDGSGNSVDDISVSTANTSSYLQILSESPVDQNFF